MGFMPSPQRLTVGGASCKSRPKSQADNLKLTTGHFMDLGEKNPSSGRDMKGLWISSLAVIWTMHFFIWPRGLREGPDTVIMYATPLKYPLDAELFVVQHF